MINLHTLTLHERLRISLCLLTLLWATTALGFNPPVDRKGPLTVRIEGPSVVSETEIPSDVRVLLENSSDQNLTGSLRLAGVDRWQCEPAEDVPFQVAAHGEASYRFKVVAGTGTYAAPYPLHAYATFDWEGKRQVAHPILIIESKVPPPSATIDRLPWKPMKVAGDRALALWEMPTHRAVIQVFGQDPETMPVGWSGSAQPSRASVSNRSGTQLAGEFRDAVAIHPPWHEDQIGTAWIEYPLALPQATGIKLDFATAVTPTGEGDGVTFRVRVANMDAPSGQVGEVVFERHSAAKTWEAGEADLSRFAGRTIRLQLESHPGPQNNTAFDQSYWAEPKLIVGTPPVAPPFPPQAMEESSLLGELQIGASGYKVYVAPGGRGLLDADVGFVSPDGVLFFRGFRVHALGIRLDDPSSPASLVDVTRDPRPGGCRIRHRFETARGTFDLIGNMQIVNDTLQVRFHMENAPQPQAWNVSRIEALSVGVFSQAARRVYAGHGNVVQQPAAFRLSFDGHRLATSHVGFDFDDALSLVQAVDLPPDSLEVDPSSRHYSLHAAGQATFTFIPGRNVWEAARHYRQTNGWKAAGGVQRLAGRFVFDLWGGRYGESKDGLQRAFLYGLTDSAVVWHNWQRWGYDYRLPEIYPPNPDLGSEQELRDMIDACRQADVLFALHDNYIDIYPDAEGFSYEKNVAFTVQGTPTKAWVNKGRGAQSYRYRADRVESFLQDNLRTIHQQLKPSAYFIDVWSSIKPYDYWTADGRFFDRRYTRDSWREHFAWIRELLGDGAPQISESGHDQLIGWLDGAQTNHLRVGRPLDGYYSWSVWNIDCEDAERIPWFDYAHHDRFILHGAGYSGRYQAGLDARMHGMYSDDYIATEVLTGHPTMVSRPFDRDVVRKYWLTQELMRSLAMQTIESVEFCDDDLHRQHVRWSGGGDVWVNRGESDWEVAGHCLPQYGFLARVPSDAGPITAAICREQGLAVERAESPRELYVNARRIAGRQIRIRPTVAEVRPGTARRLELALDWQVDDPIPEGYRPFIHFVDTAGEIVFQGSYDLNAVSRQETGRLRLPVTAQVPEARKVGESFELRVGLYPPGRNAPRLAILGADDGELRIRLGTVKIVDQADAETGIQWEPLVQQEDPYLARNNPDAKAVDFGYVVTPSACRLTREGQSLILTPLPDEPATGTSWELRWDQLPWQLPRPTRLVTIAEDGSVLEEKPVGDRILIQHTPGAFAYRLTGQ